MPGAICAKEVLQLEGAREGGTRAREDDHEAITLRLNHDAVVRGDPLADTPIVLAHHLEPELLTEPLEYRGRSLDVREDNSHGPI